MALVLASPAAEVLPYGSFVCVARLGCSAGVRQRDRTAQRIRDEASRPKGVGSTVDLVDPQPRQQIRSRRAACEFLHYVQSVVEEIRRRPVHRLTSAPPQRVVGEARSRRPGQRRKPTARVPTIREATVAREIAVRIIGQRGTRPVGQTVIRVVGRTRQRRRKVQAGKGAANLRAPARVVVRVGQGADGGAAARIGDPGQLVRSIVNVGRDDPVGQGQRRSPAGGIVNESHLRAALRDGGKAVRIVIGVGDGILTRHLEAGAPVRCIVCVRNTTLRNGLGRKAIEAIVGARDSSTLTVRDLRGAITRIVSDGHRCVRRRQATSRTGLSVGGRHPAVEPVISKRADLAIPIGKLFEIVVAIVGIGLDSQQRIGAAPGGDPYPSSLQVLLKDPRFPTVVRHLRQIYVDPLTGRDDWLLVKTPGGEIMGVGSTSDRHPIKVDRFPPPFEAFAGKSHYSEWLFYYQMSPIAAARPSGASAP